MLPSRGKKIYIYILLLKRQSGARSSSLELDSKFGDGYFPLNHSDFQNNLQYVLCKKDIFKMLQISQENVCNRDSF